MNQPYNEIKASSLAGVVLDCDLSTGLKIGGGTATDNTAALNAVLATASATNPIHLILDGPTSVTGLSIAPAGRTKISGIGRGSGIFIKSGSNADPINNGKYLPEDNPGATPPASGYFVELRDFQINGNRGDGTTGNSNSGNPRGSTVPPYWYCNINLSNVIGVVIENMYIYDASTYSIRLNNCSDVVIASNTINNPNATSGFNNDCIHVDGPGSDIRIFGNDLTNNNSDDCIAINSTEGYGGVVDRVTIIGNTMNKVIHGLAVRGGAEGQIGSVIFTGNTGSVLSAVILVNSGNGGNAPDLAVRSLVASQNEFTITTGGASYIQIVGGAGEITLTDCEWLSPGNNVAFIGGAAPGGGVVSCVTVNNCRIYRTVAGNSTTTPLISASAALTIKKLIINGFYIVNEQSQSYAAIPALLAMTNVTIAQLFVADLDYTNITLLADAYTNITSISGMWQPESNIQSKTAAYTLLPTDRVVLASTTAGSFAVALPAKAYAGQKHSIKNTGTANTLTITGTIDGSANPTLTTLAKMTIQYDGTSWWTV